VDLLIDLSTLNRLGHRCSLPGSHDTSAASGVMTVPPIAQTVPHG
jgi:hypothetical protein